MKKILTFLVMLFATVSILSAQTTPRISYQAVVRDVNNDHNLVMNKTCQVTVNVYDNNSDEVLYTEELEGTTNRNGMIALEIGANDQEGKLAQIDWSNAYIQATFSVNGENVSIVQTPINAVPYALQAGSYNLTTEQIVKYLRDVATPEDLKAIQQAIVENDDQLKDYLKDTVINYIKAHPSEVRELGLYFLAQIDQQDLTDANAAVSPEVKAKVKQFIKDYAKSPSGKEIAVDVLKHYLQNATTQDAKALWTAVRSNENFSTVFNAFKDSLTDYIIAHPELVIKVGKAYINNATPEMVYKAYNYLRTHENAAYTYMLNKFENYLYHYLTEVYFAVSDQCASPDRIDICQLQEQVNQILDTDCDDFVSLSVTASQTSGVIATVELAAGLEINAADFEFSYKVGADGTLTTLTKEAISAQPNNFKLIGLPTDLANVIVVAKWRGMCDQEFAF